MKRIHVSAAMLVALLMSGLALAADTPAKLYFDTGKADVPADGAAKVAPLIDQLKANKAAKAKVSGYHDSTGDAVANAELARNRAQAVVALLIAGGVGEEQVIMEKPVATTGGGDAKEARRVEIILVAAEAAPAATTDTPAETAAAPPAPNKGDTAWMIVATVLVILMTIPGLALFYSGMVRAKNALSVLMKVFVTFALVAVLWSLYGYSLAFTEGNAFFGGFSKAFLKGITPDSGAATFSKGVYIPEYIYVVFQLTFAAITPALIVGAFAERVKFSAVLLFMVLWLTFSYLPIAHMVWYWAGPDAFTDEAAGKAAVATAGFLSQKGALDFAGGTVVHINSGIAGLVGCLVIGKRLGYGREAMPPHSLVMTMIGASLLWVGWFGFNVGSNLEANGVAAMVFVNTLIATAAATLSWMFAEWMVRGRPTMLGAASGAVAGLVAITPACGFVGPMGAIIIGFVAGVFCLWGVTGLKKMFGYDDSLDVFGVHCLGGIWGALATGIFCAPWLGGTGVWDYVTNAVSPDYSIASQVTVQALGVITTLVWSGVVAFISYKIADAIVGLRVTEEQERVGLDETQHGESAYNM